MFVKLLAFFFVLIAACSCTIQKRTFNNGFYVSWKKSHSGKETKRIVENINESRSATSDNHFIDSVNIRLVNDTSNVPDASVTEDSIVYLEGSQITKPPVPTLKLDSRHSFRQNLKKRQFPPRFGPIISFGLPTDFYAILAHVGFLLCILAIILIIYSVDALLPFLLLLFAIFISIGATVTGLTRLIQGDWGDFYFTRVSILAYAIFWSLVILVGVIFVVFI